jgi:hypothetical protein
LRHQHALGRNELELEGVRHPRGSSKSIALHTG